MVKCIVDGDVLELGGPNLLKLGYYSNPPKENPIIWKEVEDLARNCKVVDELFDSKDIPRLKIFYIPCSDWSARSEQIIEKLINRFVDALTDEYERYPGKFCDPPKVITVVQDKDYWPGYELDDPLVLQRRAAKEKDFEKGLLVHTPDRKIVKNHMVFESVINHVDLFFKGKINEDKKKKQLSRAQPYSLKRYLTDIDDDDASLDCSIKRSPDDSEFEELEEEEKASILEEIEVRKAKGIRYIPGCWFVRGPTPGKRRARYQFIMDLRKARKAAQSALKEKEENKHFPNAQPLSQEELSLNDTYPEKFVKDNPTLFTPIVEKKELPSAESSSFKRSGLDLAEGFLFDAHIPKKRRCPKQKKYLPRGECDRPSKCTSSGMPNSA